ncbi:MAG: Nascent polypeptide-associated complex protein [Candidatus Aenigmarchaeota archaeon]|nr:Nascent polypeptide-associated complex protein [Candidatus Aenigmarchaeota archaeon]RLF28870.1 MAG: Nascent polypeptide-associated complex protein [Thermoplasmata archaeon]
MLGKLKDIKKMTELMKEMKMNMRELKANRVVIECDDKNIVIDEPEIIIAKIIDRDSYQITGKVHEEPAGGPTEEDIKMIMEQTGKDKETILKKLKELNNDLARTIMELKDETQTKESDN